MRMRFIASLLLLLALIGGCTEVVSPRRPDAAGNLLERGSDFLLLLYHPKDQLVPFRTVTRAALGPYSQPILFVARSANDWESFHSQVIQAHALLVGPAPPPPPGVDFDRGDAVLLVADGAYPAQVVNLGRRGLKLRCAIQFDWSQRMDAVEYAPVHAVTFKGWPGLRSRFAIGAEDVTNALEELGVKVERPS